MKTNPLLLLDGFINIFLGLLLIIFPKTLVDLLGLPPADPAFYPSVLGGVLFGIGLALFREYQRKNNPYFPGLGLSGAIVINLSGGLILMGWLLFGSLSIPPKGMITLWILAVGLVGISVVEGWNQFRLITLVE